MWPLQLRVLIKCNKVHLQTYNFLQKSSFAWYWIKCFEDFVLFSIISNRELSQINLDFQLFKIVNYLK